MRQDKLGPFAHVEAAGNVGRHDGIASVPPRGSEVGLVLADADERTAPSCLVVEDDPVLRRLLSRHLSAKGWKVTGAASVAEARTASEGRAFQFIVTDSLLPDGSGLDFVADLPKAQGAPAVLVTSGDRRGDQSRATVRHATLAFLLKPFSMPALDAALTRVEGATRLRYGERDEERSERFRTRYLPDASLAEPGLLSSLDALARSSCPVLLQGSAQKSLHAVAMALHDAGARNEHDFVAIDCGQVLDLELVLADALEAGTLLLERLELLSPAGQACLLGLFTEGEVERRDGKARLRPRVRIIATISQTRDELVACNSLSPELAALLSPLEVRVESTPGAVS